jgi:hypothetical protein
MGGWTMGLMDYGKAAGSAADVLLRLKEMNQRKELEQQRLAQQAAQQQRQQEMMKPYYEGMIEDRRATQQDRKAQRALADTAQQQAMADRETAQQEKAARQFDFLNANVTANMPGLMSSGAVGEGSSDPRALAQVAKGTMPGMQQPTAMDYARISAKHGDPSSIVNLQKSDDLIQSRKEIQDAKIEAQKEALAARLEQAIKLLEVKQDFASKLQAEKLQSVLDRIKLKSEVAPDKPTKNIAVYIDKVNGAKHVINLDNPKHREWLSTYGSQLMREGEQAKLNEIEAKNPYGAIPKHTAATSSSKYKILKVD